MAKSGEILSEALKILETQEYISKRDILEKFPDQSPLVSYTLSKALKDGLLLKAGSTRGAKYLLARARQEENFISKTYWRGKQSEDDVFHELQDLFLKKYELNENASNIVSYAFTEMVNNAFDHSGSNAVEVSMSVNGEDIEFTVRDRGIGVFRSVMEGYNLRNENEALAELTKGRVTTAPKWHSGEGIYFTSRAADVFRLASHELILERKNGDVHSDFGVIKQDKQLIGTRVEFQIQRHTKRRLAHDVFGQFQSEPGEHDFGKTEVEVGLFQRGDIHVSRSQAKRIMLGLEKFKKVILDFDAVPLIGQGFADEIFRVWTREHPQTIVTIRNAVPTVQFMIDRVHREHGQGGNEKEEP